VAALTSDFQAITIGISGRNRYSIFANISSPDLLFVVFLLRLPSVQPANSTKSQFILCVDAICLGWMARWKKLTF
jgi:hypothetical protein